MSDRIAVMKDGRFEQLGTPAEVYDSPRTSYVARFVGTANVLTGTVEAVEDDVLKVACAGGCAGALRRGYSFAPGAPITLAVRSEHVEFTNGPRCLRYRGRYPGKDVCRRHAAHRTGAFRRHDAHRQPPRH
mgnify:CR=1 FL=1